jgi:hypothetical protein
MKVYGTVDENGEDETVYDHVILAADLAPVQSIFKNTYDSYKSHANIVNSLDICNNNYFDKMKISPDYRVFRGWFDKQPIMNKPVLETPEHKPINMIAQYHLLEEEYSSWANETGGSGERD